jgi:Flp pilus assembly pilin Flp
MPRRRARSRLKVAPGFDYSAKSSAKVRLRLKAKARSTPCSRLCPTGGEGVFIQFIFEEDGQSLVEYGLLISLIALIVVAMIKVFGGKIPGLYTVSNSIGTST